MIQKMFLKMLKSALSGKPFVYTENLNKDEWITLFRLCANHRVLPIMYNYIADSYPFSKDDLIPLKNQTKAIVLEQVLQTQAFTELYKKLTDIGLSPIVVKGIVCRELYPQPDTRFSSDEDLWVGEQDFGKYCKAFESFSLSPIKPQKENCHQLAFKGENRLKIELHKSLFPTDSELFSTWNEVFEHAFENTVFITAEDCRIKTLSETDSMLYLLLHALKHFFHSGVGIRQVCDIILFANHKGEKIDWNRFFTICKKLKADKFALAVFAIGEKHLSFCKSSAKFPSEINLEETNELPLLADILSGGIFGSSSMARQHSSNITFDAAQGKKTNIIRRAFPPAKKLGSKYHFAKKHPLLLPVAWSHRLINYKKETVKDPDNNPSAAINIGKRRIELLKIYGLISE